MLLKLNYTVTKAYAAFEYGEKAVKLFNDAAAVGMISYLNTLLGGDVTHLKKLSEI